LCAAESARHSLSQLQRLLSGCRCLSGNTAYNEACPLGLSHERTGGAASKHAEDFLNSCAALSQCHANPYVLSVMDHGITAVERAFQLARSSACTCVKDIKERLMAEGYSANQISGRVL
jgi:hypothetical protein